MYKLKIKKLSFFISLFLWACNPEEQVLVAIQTSGIPAYSVLSLETNDGHSFAVQTDSLGHININTLKNVNFPVSALLFYQNTSLPLYLNDSTRMEIFINFDENPHAEFYGNGAFENEIWNGKHLTQITDADTLIPEKQFVENLYSHLYNNYWLIDSIVPQDSLFRIAVKQKYSNMLLEKMFNYLVKNDIHKPSNESLEFVECILTNENLWNNDLAYTTVLRRWIDWVHIKTTRRYGNESFDTLRSQIAYVDSLFSTQPIKEFAVNHLAVDYIKHHGLDSVQSIQKMYRNYVEDKTLSKQFEALCKDTTYRR